MASVKKKGGGQEMAVMVSVDGKNLNNNNLHVGEFCADS